MENAPKLAEDDLKLFIIYIAYNIMDPGSARSQNKLFKPCHDQYQRVKNSLKDKLTRQLPGYEKFITLENRFFGNKESVTQDEFDEFIDKYFGKSDWDIPNLEW